jgi:hypothetical protein
MHAKIATDALDRLKMILVEGCFSVSVNQGGPWALAGVGLHDHLASWSHDGEYAPSDSTRRRARHPRDREKAPQQREQAGKEATSPSQRKAAMRANVKKEAKRGGCHYER